MIFFQFKKILGDEEMAQHLSVHTLFQRPGFGPVPSTYKCL